MGIHTITANILLQLSDLSQRRVLSARSKQISQALESDALVAALVEERERFFVVGGGLRFVIRVISHSLQYLFGPGLPSYAPLQLCMGRRQKAVIMTSKATARDEVCTVLGHTSFMYFGTRQRHKHG